MVKTAKRGRPPLASVEVSCSGRIEEWDIFVSVHSRLKEQLRSYSLTCRGPLLAPVLGADSFEISLDQLGDRRTEGDPPVGGILSVKPKVRAYVWLNHLELDLITKFAAADRKMYVHFVASKPRYGRGTIKSCSFSLKPIE